MSTSRIALLAALSTAFASAAAAQDVPRFTADFLAEIETDGVVSASDPDAEITDTYLTFTAAFGLEYAEGSGLFAALVFEPVQDATDDRFFDDHGLYVDSLYLRHDFGPAAALAGKFAPAFGQAWDIAPGLYGADFAGDYELLEKLGASVEVPFAAAGGEHVFTAAIYTADSTALSRSVITSRGRVRRSDGGPSNSDDPSFALSLQGAFGDIGYNAGFLRQARGDGDDRAETGGVAGLTYAMPLAEGVLSLIGEGAYLHGYGGERVNAFVGTAGAAYSFQDWTFSAVYANRSFSDSRDNDHLATVGVDYQLTEAVGLSLAYRYGEEDGGDSHTVGAYVSFAFGVSAPLR
jgi:hypothetical protein